MLHGRVIIMYIELLAERFYDYSLFIKGYSKDTIKRYRNTIKFFCRYNKIERIEEVNQQMVRDFFFKGRSERNWKPSSFISYQAALLVFFRWCVANHYIKTNFAEDIEVPKAEKRLPAKLTKQDSLRILEVAYNYPYDRQFLRCRNHAIFSMFLFAGLRKTELLKLRFTDVDIENLSIFVRQGKGSKDRVIPMSYTLAQSLKRYVTERNRLKRTCPEFYTSLTTNSGLSDAGLKHLVTQMRKASGVKFTIHKLRHTFATLMLEGGCDIFSLSKMMGHSDIKTTTIYLAASAEHLRGQMMKHPLN